MEKTEFQEEKNLINFTSFHKKDWHRLNIRSKLLIIN